MHVSSFRDPVEIRCGTVYYQLDEYFSYKGSSSMMRIYLLRVCAVISEVSVVCEVRITQVAAGGPRKNCAQKQEAWKAEEKVCEKPLTIYEQQRDCAESQIASELRLCVVRACFHLYDNTEMGFQASVFPWLYLLCYVCLISPYQLYVFLLMLLMFD